jgi:hypothetical protein
MSAPYKVWETRTSLGVMRDVEPAFTYWSDLAFSQRQINFTTEWVDFEKLPAVRKIAPFVRPLGTGKPIYNDQSTGARFKPAYIKLKDAIDPMMPMVKRPGVDATMIGETGLSPEQRRNAIRAAMTVQHVQAIQRRWEWLAARAVIDGKVTIVGEEYPATELDFRRASNHDVTLGSGARWGDSGVSIIDEVQKYADRMFDADFGGFPTRMTFGTAVWAVIRNALKEGGELYKHMDINIRGGAVTGERGVIGSDKVIKVGELMVGGASGARIEMFLYRDTYVDTDGVEKPFMDPKDVVFTAPEDRIMGYRCFGAIVDPYANYQSLEIFPRNWMEMGDPAVEYLLHQSAPLMVPVNPNGTLRVRAVA